jgi:predicted DNA-binding transcriptional regulator AlpA
MNPGSPHVAPNTRKLVADIPSVDRVDVIIKGAAAGRILKLAHFAALLGISPSTLKRRWPLGDFPAPIKICAGRIGWLEAEILKWQVGRERDAQKKKGGE